MDATVGRVAVVLVCLLAVGALAIGSGLAAESPGEPAAVDVAQSAPDLELSSTAYANVFLANETPSVAVETDAAAVAWTVHDARGRLVADGTTDVGGEATLSLPIDDVGHYTLRVRATADGATDPGATAGGGGATATARTALAVLPADDPPDDPFFGSQAHFDAGWDLQLLDVLERAGVGSVRDHTRWRDLETERGTYDFERSDRFVEPLFERGFDPLWITAYGNQLYDEDGYPTASIPYTDAYRRAYVNWTRATVAHYDDLQHVEVWNEPNLEDFAKGPTGTSPEAYAELLEATAPAIEAERPDVTVIAGSTAQNYSSGRGEFDRSWWEAVLDAGAAEHAHALSIHAYRESPEDFDRDVEWLREATRERTGGEALPIWVTEVGWRTDRSWPGGGHDARQARYLVQTYAQLRATGVERVYWYNSRDQDADWAEGFGLLRYDEDESIARSPRPGLVTYATTSRQLAGTEFVEARDGPVEHYVYEGGGANSRSTDGNRTDGDERTHVLWSEERTDLTLQTDAPVTVTSSLGESTTLTPTDGEIYLTVGRDPVFVAGGVDDVREGAPVDVAAPTLTGAGADEITVGLTNDGDAERTVRHRIGDETATVTAGPGERATETLARPAILRPRTATAVDVVSVDGEVVGRLLAPVGAPTARLGAEPFVTGGTVETRDRGHEWEVSEATVDGTGNGEFTVANRDGVSCWETDVDADQSGRTLFLDVADEHAPEDGATVPVTVQYFDGGEGAFHLEYERGPGARTPTDPVEVEDTGTWQTATVELSNARFADGIRGDLFGWYLMDGHDLRLTTHAGGDDVCIASLTLGDEPASPVEPGGDPSDGGGTDGRTDGDGNDSGGSGDADDGLPGFGVALAFLALLAGGLLASWRQH